MDQVPRYRREDIERRTEAVLRYYVPETLSEGQPTPLGDLAACVKRQLGATFSFDQMLGNNSAGERIIGACYFHPRFAILVDSSSAGDMQSARFRLTLAHELGHLSLHRKLRLDFQSLDATAIGPFAES